MTEHAAEVPPLPRELVRRVVDRLTSMEPETIAVVVRGSYARGLAEEGSDFDVSAITRAEPAAADWRTWFEPLPSGRPLHVSAGAHSVESWLSYRNQPAEWALGLPGITVAKFVTGTDEARAALGDPPSNPHPPRRASLEDFVEAISKVRRAAARGDELAVRWRAMAAAREIPGLLRDVNPPLRVHDRLEALRAALEFPVAPEHQRHDFPVLLGLRPTDAARVRESALRAARELLALLRERNPHVDEQPGLAEALLDGTLERHLGL